jgi:hypothetical protein
MMADYESRLSIEVKSDGVEKAKKSLADLTKAGSGAEKATTDLGRSSKQSGNEMQRAGKDAQYLAKETEKIGLSAKQTTFALRQVPAQFTDIVVSLQAGQAPLQVLLQQGGQLKDSFGGIGNAARALGGYISGLVTPVSLTVGAVVGLAAAAKSAYDEVSEFNVALQNTGSIAAGSPIELRKLSSEIGLATGLYGDAKESILTLASTGQISYKNIADAAKTATLASEFLGRSVEDTAKDFVALQKDPVNAIVKLNESMNFLTLEQYKQIKSLKDQGKEQEAVNLAFKLYQEAIAKGSANVAKDLNIIEEAWFRVKTGAATALQSVQEFFGPLTDEQRLNQAKQQLESYIKVANTFPKGSFLGNGAQADVKRQEAIVKAIEDEINARQKAAQAKSDSAIKEKQSIADEIKLEEERQKQREKDLRLAEQQARQRENAAKQRAQYLQGIQNEINLLKEQDKLILAGTGVQDARTIAQLRANNVSESTISSLISATKQHETLLETLKKEESFYAEYEKSLVNQQAAIEKQIETIIQSADAINAEVTNYDKLPSAITEVTIARKQDQLAIIKGLGLSTDDIEREIEALKRLKEAQNRKEIVDAVRKDEEERYKTIKDTNEKIKREIERTAESINRSLTDALLRGFESGKSFAENFKDTLYNMFRTLILRPAIEFILAPITSAVAKSVVGSQNTGVTGAATDIFSNLRNVFTNTNNSIIGGIQSIGNTIKNGMGGIRDSIGGFISKNAGAISNGISYAGALLQLSQGNFAGAAGTAIGTFFGGPVGGAIGSFIGSAVGSLFGGRPKTKKYSTGSNSTYADGRITSVNGVSGLAGYGRALGGGDALAELNETFSKALGSLFKSFGMSDEIKTSSSLFQRSSSKTRAWGYFTALFGDGAKVSTSSGGTAFASAQQALNALINNVLTKGIVQGINASTLPQSIKSLFDGLTDKTVVGNMIQSTINLGKANQSLIDSFDITAAQAASVALQSGLAGDELAAVVNQLVESANASRSVGDMLVEFRESLTESMGGTLFDSLAEFDGALKNIDVSTQAGIEAFYELFKVRTDFANFTKTIDSLRGGVKGSLLGIVSDSEKQAILNADLNELFDNLGLSIPATIEELAALGKSIDYTTAEGINLANAFPALVNAFLATKNVIADLTKTADDFATEFEYLRYQALGKNYGAGFANSFVPSFAVGTNYVPADGLAMIHQGERIIPAADNQQLMQNSVDMVQAIRELRTDVTNLNIAMQTAAVNTGKTAKSLDNIERGGVIISDIGIDGNEQVLKVEVVA